MAKDNSNLSSQLNENICEEIKYLLSAVDQQKTSKSKQARLAIMRLFNDLTIEQWEEMASKVGLDNWIALDLDEENVRDLYGLQDKLDTLVHKTNHDPLTGLGNRRAFKKALHVEIERSYRFKTPLSLAVIDIDDFKVINDTHGHICGDRVLARLARTLKTSIRKMDFAARIGGEEFAIILSGSGLMHAHRVLERIQKKIHSQEVYCSEQDVNVSSTCSMGLACYKGSVPMDQKRLIHEADKALYKAKSEGKNRIISAPIMALSEVSDTTLVKKEEKNFLYSGT